MTRAAGEAQGRWPDIDLAGITPAEPPLLEERIASPSPRIRHLAATHIEHIGAAETMDNPQEEDYYRERFRREALGEAPIHVETISGPSAQTPAAKIGDIVHEALRYWRTPGTTDREAMLALLRSYAWNLGLTDAQQNDSAAQQAYRLLSRFEQSKVYQEIVAAQQVYRETPFVHPRDDIVIHGVIDILYQRSDGAWVMLDYKTSRVFRDDGMDPTVNDLVEHARRFYLQVGVYAEAAALQLGGQTPLTCIHYIRYHRTVTIDQQDWRNALESKGFARRIEEALERDK